MNSGTFADQGQGAPQGNASEGPQLSSRQKVSIAACGTINSGRCALVGDNNEMTVVIRGRIDSEGRFAGTAELTLAYRDDALSFRRLHTFMEKIETIQQEKSMPDVHPEDRVFQFDPYRR